LVAKVCAQGQNYWPGGKGKWWTRPFEWGIGKTRKNVHMLVVCLGVTTMEKAYWLLHLEASTMPDNQINGYHPRKCQKKNLLLKKKNQPSLNIARWIWG
jgi:hypothetical protein